MIDDSVVLVSYRGSMVSIGCPPGGCCRNCAGGWPGTLMTGAAIIQAAKRGVLNPEKLGCSTTQMQARIAVELYSPQPTQN